MISEYEIGRHGWIMVLAFLSLASSCVTLSVAIRSQVRTVSGKTGVTLLMISAAGMTIAAVFTTDPITASQDELTTHGKLHGLGFLLGIPSFPIAATLVSRSLVPGAAGAPVGCRPALDRPPGVRFERSLPASAGWRRVRPGRADRVAQPVLDSGLRRVANGGSLASHPGTRARSLD